MLCDKREHLVGKLILNNYLIENKLDENWLVNILLLFLYLYL